VNERMMDCGPCARSTPHEYTGDSWSCMRCKIGEMDIQVRVLADALHEMYHWRVETGRPMFLVRRECALALELVGRPTS
jgi:hypothetical protein